MLLHEVPVPPVQAAAAMSETMQQQRTLSQRRNYAVDQRSGRIIVDGEYDPFRDDSKPFSIHTVTR